MKGITSLIALTGTVSMLVSGCKKENDFKLYENDPAIYFYAGPSAIIGNNSLAFNFVLLPVNEKTDTLYIPMRIMGFPSEKDRAVRIQARDSSTAKPGVHYKLGDAVMHAGRYTDSIPVYVYRTAGMIDTSFALYLDLLPSGDFKLGYKEALSYTVTITDRVVPPFWSFTFSSTFGAYSNVKFRFMVSVLKITSFGSILPSLAAAMAGECKLALSEYEAINGPLIDEKGARVVFP